LIVVFRTAAFSWFVLFLALQLGLHSIFRSLSPSIGLFIRIDSGLRSVVEALFPQLDNWLRQSHADYTSVVRPGLLLNAAIMSLVVTGMRTRTLAKRLEVGLASAMLVSGKVAIEWAVLLRPATSADA